MARWIRDPVLRAFQTEVRAEIDRAAALAAGSRYAVYIILDPGGIRSSGIPRGPRSMSAKVRTSETGPTVTCGTVAEAPATTQ
jgi:hypothetical protein